MASPSAIALNPSLVEESESESFSLFEDDRVYRTRTAPLGEILPSAAGALAKITREFHQTIFQRASLGGMLRAAEKSRKRDQEKEILIG